MYVSEFTWSLLLVISLITTQLLQSAAPQMTSFSSNAPSSAYSEATRGLTARNRIYSQDQVLDARKEQDQHFSNAKAPAATNVKKNAL